MHYDIESVTADVARAWGLTLGETLSGGTYSPVRRAKTRAGASCVLKLFPPPVEFAGTYESERDVLAAADGRGYVRLVDCDDARRALLLEELGPTMNDSGGSVDDWIVALCSLLRETWDLGMRRPDTIISAAEKAEWFVDFIPRIWQQHPAICDRSVVDEAIRFAESRGAAYDPSRSVVLHGDAHPWNALSVGDGRFKFIDPDPYFGEPAADLGVPLREWNTELLADGQPLRGVQTRTALLVAETGCGPVAIWEWGFLERVGSAMAWAVEDRLDVAREGLVVAEACVGAGPK